MNEILLTRTQAASLLGVSTDTLRKLVMSGQLQQVRLAPNTHPRYRKTDVEKIGSAKAVSV